MSQEKKDANFFINKGLENYNKDKYEEAIKDYDEAIRLDLNYASAYNNRAVAKGDLGRHEEAIKDYDEAIRLDPNDASAYYNRGVAKDDLGRHEEAIKDYDEAIRLDPKDVSAHHNRGVAKGKLGRHEEAIKDYDKVTHFDPNKALAYYNRGTTKSSLGRHEQAIMDFDEAIRLDPNKAEAYHNRGGAKGNLGRHEEAIEDYEIFIKIAPQNVPEYVERAKVYIKNIRDSIKAQKSFEPPPQPAIPPTTFKETRAEAIFFLDMRKSTEIMDTYGVEHFLEMFFELKKIFSNAADKSNCLFKKNLGDGFMATFSKSEDAVNTGLGILENLKERNRRAIDGSQAINIKIGIDFGGIKIDHDSDRYGERVVSASRIEGIHKDDFDDEIELPEENRMIVSYHVWKQIEDNPAYKFTKLVDAKLKGFSGRKVELFLVEKAS